MELYDYQNRHVERLSEILESYPIALDTSQMGAGKTYTSLYLAQKYNFPILVVGPKTMKSVWEDLAEEYQIHLIDYLSYQKLRSTKGKKPKHPYLLRQDVESNTYFTTTPEWEKLIDSGILLIFDEVQMIKNKTDQYQACQTLSASILKKGDVSRVLLLSGSPFDKEEHSVNLLRLMGFIEHPVLCRQHKERGQMELLGVQELIDKCRLINSEKLEFLMRVYGVQHSKIPNFCFRLFIEIVKPAVQSQMPVPRIEAERDIANGYYTISKPEEEQLREAIGYLACVSKYNRATNTANVQEADWAMVTKALMSIEGAKIPLLERLVRSALEKPNHKVIVFVQFVSTIESLTSRLSDLEVKPLLLYGKTSASDRASAIEGFQKDPTKRLLISNVKIGGVGLSLHDTDGRYPRTSFIVPNYSLIDLIQAGARTYRQGTRSKATIRFVYGKLQYDLKEVQILSALCRKSKVLKELLDIHRDDGILLPSDYQEVQDDL